MVACAVILNEDTVANIAYFTGQEVKDLLMLYKQLKSGDKYLYFWIDYEF